MVQALQTQMLGSFSTKKISPKTKADVKRTVQKARTEVRKAAKKAPAVVKQTAQKARANVERKAKRAPAVVQKNVARAKGEVQKAAKKARAEVRKAAKKAPPSVKKAARVVAKKTRPVVRPVTQAVRSKTGSGGWFGDAGGASDLSKWYGSTRQLWLPKGLLDLSEVAPYLDGTLAGDYGYDPLGIGTSSAEVERYRAYELLHGRWAMLGAAGMLIPEGLAANGADIKGATWYETGAAMLPASGDGLLNYFAVPFAVINNPLPLAVIAAIELGLMYLVETYRQKGQGPAGYAPGIGFYTDQQFTGLDPLYPGGPLDPLGLASDPEVFDELKVKEIKNGRLAMMATLGFAFQAVVTGEGPYANWSKHIADPFGYNLITVLGGEDRVPTL